MAGRYGNQRPTGRRGVLHPVVPQLFALLAAWILAVAIPPRGYADEMPDESPYLERVYAGVTLGEWLERIRSQGPSPQAGMETVAGLTAIVRDDELPARYRQQAAFTLGRIGPSAQSAVPVLAEILSLSPDVETRLWCLKALSYFGPTAAPAAPALVRRLKEGQTSHAELLGLVDTLSRLGATNGEVVPTLAAVLRGALPSATSPLTPGQREELQALAADSLATLGPAAAPAVPALIRVLDDGAEPVRRSAAAALGAVGTRSDIAAGALARVVMFDESAAVRDAAADALAAVGVEALPVLRRLLQDADAEVRWRAARALGNIGKAASASTGDLKAALNDPADIVRISALEAHWRIAESAEPLIPALLQEFANDDRQIRIRAYRLLLSMQDQARPAVEPLRRLSNDDPRPAVRQAAQRALEALEAREDATSP